MSGHFAAGGVKELDAGPRGDHRAVDDFHRMAAVMLEAEIVLTLDRFLNVAGTRIEGDEVEIVIQRAPQIHVFVRSPETALEAEQIDGHRIVRGCVIGSPKLASVVGRNHVQLPAARERDHVAVDDQRRRELGCQDDRRPFRPRTVRAGLVPEDDTLTRRRRRPSRGAGLQVEALDHPPVVVHDLFSVGGHGHRHDHRRFVRPALEPGFRVHGHQMHVPARTAPDVGRGVRIDQHDQDAFGQDHFFGRTRVLQRSDQVARGGIQHADRRELAQRGVHRAAVGDQPPMHLDRADFLAASRPAPGVEFMPPELNPVKGIAGDQRPTAGVRSKMGIVQDVEDAAAGRDQTAGLDAAVPARHRLPLQERRRTHSLVLADRVARGVVPRVRPGVDIRRPGLAVRGQPAVARDSGRPQRRQHAVDFLLSYLDLFIQDQQQVHRVVGVGQRRALPRCGGYAAVLPRIAKRL